MTKISKSKNVEKRKPHWIEWATGALSALVVVIVILWIGRDAMIDRDPSPNLIGVILSTEQRSDGFQVLFEIRNDASETASQVNVQGEIRDGNLVLERVETVLDYVPGNSKAKGGFVFRQDPAGKTVTVHANAFSNP